MKNLLSRDEYLKGVEEGFIKNAVKKGWEKVKSWFKIGMRKIKDFIAVFDTEGNVFPVVSPQAVIDKFADSDAVKIVSTQAMDDSVIDAGGKVGSSKLTGNEDDGMYDEGPDGKEYFSWMKDKKYKETDEYQNFMTMTSTVKEYLELHAGEALNESNEETEESVDESWDGVVKARNKYVDRNELRGVPGMSVDEFENVLKRLVRDWSIRSGKETVRASDGKVSSPLTTVLVFGAPGIGKSTIPNMVVENYNERVKEDPSKMISIISINCANIDEGDFMMPTMPKEVDVMSAIEDFAETFPDAAEFVAGLDKEQRNQIAKTITQSSQFKATDAPKSWLPSYRETGNPEIDDLLDANANGGVYRSKDGKTHKTGGGGIIIFDEFLRCKPGVFGQLMNFLLDRRLNGWQLGSKWALIACSNRPCDDDEVQERWGDWSKAAMDRWSKFYQLIPDPKGWQEWARKKGCEELLLEFIFDKSSMVGDEYPRWHTMVSHGAGDSHQVKPISPRSWERAFREIGTYVVDHHLGDMSEMRIDAIKETLKGSFDEDFVEEIVGWMEDRMDKVDLDGIIEDPKSVYLPKKFVNDEARALTLVQNLLREMEGRFKDDPGKCTDDMLSNIVVWLGINYKYDMVAVQNFIIELTKSVFPEKGEHRLSKYVKTFMTLEAAYPEKGLEERCKDNEVDEEMEPDERFPEGSFETIKEMMREFFPWRISGDTIKYYGELDTSEEPPKKEEDEDLSEVY